MCVRYIGFVLLVWFAGVLHALSVPQHCEAPLLSGGYLVPEQDTYPDNTTLTYACDKDRKPVVEGWWAKSTCHDGKWTHVPECINETACITPTIPNEKKPESSKAWYEDGKTMRITCDEGYEHKDHRATAKCIRGEWSRVLVCEKSIQACSEPPRIPHAVIIHQRYQEVFAVDSKLRYECEDGYTVEGAAESNKFITCTAGAWTEGPLCKEGGIGGGNTASAGKGPTTRPELYETETNPPITTGDCTVDTADYSELKPAGVKNIENGGSFRFECTDVWKFDNFSDGQCTDGKMTFTRCCNRLQLGAGTC